MPRERVPSSRRRARAADARRGAARAAVRHAVRAACGRRRDRSRTRWCRWSRAPGFDWMATDEEILARTLGQRFTRDGHGHVEQPELLYRPYRVGRSGSEVACGFRDHTLSDLIGFTLCRPGPRVAAADDFVGRLVEAGRRSAPAYRRGRGDHLRHPRRRERLGALRGSGAAVPARALFDGSRSSRELQTVTMSEACAGRQRATAVDLPGLVDQRRLLHLDGSRRRPPGLGPARRRPARARERRPPGSRRRPLARAREELLIAEGSDWFWWYGDDHSSEHDLEFDELFRRHVQNVYRALEKPIPEELFVTNITTRAARGRRSTGRPGSSSR